MTGIESAAADATDSPRGKYGIPHGYDPEFHGPIRKRSCTDVLCTVLFFLFLAGWALVAAYAFYYGDPTILIHPTDSDGRKCGRDPGVENKPFLHYFDITQCASPLVLIAGCPTPEVCVEKCPTENFYAKLRAQNACPLDLREKLICKYGVDAVNDTRSCVELMKSDCAEYTLRSAVVLGRCIPNLGIGDVTTAGVVKDYNGALIREAKSLYDGAEQMGIFVQLRGFGVEAVKDYERSWWVIVTALVACMIVSLIWILLMRFIAGIMIWTALFGTLAALAYGCFYTFVRYRDLATVEGSDAKINPLDAFTKGFDSFLELRQTWLIFFIVLCILAVLLLLVLLILCKRLRIAIEVIDQASRAVTSSLSALFFPLVPWVLQLAAVALFTTLALYIASMGEKHYVTTLPDSCVAKCPSFSANSTCKPDTFDKVCKVQCPQAECRFLEYKKFALTPYFQAYNLFALFWTMFFLSAFGEMVLSGAFSAWYWTYDKRKSLPSSPLLDANGRTLRYHIGTLAFGSLIISLIRAIRVTLDYIYKKCKAYPNSQVARSILCACKCCMWCLEKFMRFINRNAYIMCSMYGKNFCSSAQKAFFLIMRNVLRVLAVDAVCDFLLFLGKAMITAGITIASFYFLDRRIPIEGLDQYVPTTHYRWLPVVTIAIGSYFIASLFFSVYTMAVDTLFICFLEDLERNDGSPEHPYYMSKDMMRILGKKNKKLKKVN